MKKLKYICVHVLIAFVLFIPILVFAAGGEVTPVQPGTGSSQGIHIQNPFRCSGDECTLMGFIRAILNNVVMPIAAVLVVLFIIFAGFKYIQAQGNPAKIKEANQNLLWALIGAGVLLGAAGISAVIENTVKTLIN